MANTKYFNLIEKKLNNNCPECYSPDGLHLTFKQKFVENAFYKAITNDVVKELHCRNCSTQIFPIRWTDDIEQVVNYQTRAVELKPKSVKLMPIAWFIIIADLILIIAIILFASGTVSL